MSVVAKLYVTALHRQASTPDAVEVEMAAVTRGEENRAWAEATPAASFKMTIQNPKAAAVFRHLGQEFLVTFEAADGGRPTLADCSEFVLPAFYRDKVSHLEPGSHEYDQMVDGFGAFVRCERCGCKPASHVEPLRSEVLAALGVV